MRYVCLLTLSLTAIFFSQRSCAEGDHYVRLQYGKSSESDFETAVLGDYAASPESNYMIGGSWGQRLSDSLFGLPLESTANIGVQYFDERHLQPDALGVTGYFKLHYLWRLPWTQKRLRLGLGEGLSYVSRIPLNEQRDFAKKGAESEKLLNHLEWTIDLPLRQFMPAAFSANSRIKEVNVGVVVWHRSSVYGLFAKTGGGGNFMGFGIEAQY